MDSKEDITQISQSATTCILPSYVKILKANLLRLVSYNFNT